MSNTATTPAQIGSLVGEIAPKHGADPLLVLAVIEVESNFDPKAKGDGGTSFGLFQLHEGGALGSHTAEWAYDPRNSIEDGCSRLASARTGTDAANVQRPANKPDYARKVDAALARNRKTAAQVGSTKPTAGAKTKKKTSILLTVLVQDVTGKYGLREGSGNRSKSHNQAVGGVPDSDHIYDPDDPETWDTWARDFNGPETNLRKAEAYLNSTYGGKLKQIMVHDAGSGLHLHVAGYSDPATGNDMHSVGFFTPLLKSRAAQAVAGAVDSGAGWVLGKGEDAASKVGGAVAGPIADVAGDIANTVGRYVLTVALVLLGGALVVIGTMHALGAGGES